MPLVQTRGAASAQGFGEFAQATAVNYIEDVFSTYLYTGTGANQTIVNGVDLSGSGGLTWIKDRAASNHLLMTTAGGPTNRLRSNGQPSYVTSTAGRDFSSFNSNGFSLGIDEQSSINTSLEKYVSWSFRKQPKFFDVVTWTGNGTNRTIPHNLGSVPGCIIIGTTAAIGADWSVYHSSLANTQYLTLNTTAAAVTDATYWNSTTPTASVFSLGTSFAVNYNTGTYIAYVFASNAGGFGLTGTDNVISCGSFTTDGSGNATVSLGYEPQFIIDKPSSTTGNWDTFDVMRGWVADTNGTNQKLNPNLSNAEVGSNYIFVNSTGFTVLGAATSATYIYIAIRRGPMKVPTSGASVFNAISRSGTGATVSVTGTGFPPDLLIAKVTNLNGAPAWFDKLRGPNRALTSSTADVEETTTTEISSFNQDGFSAGTSSTFYTNASGGYTYINWQMRRAPSFFDEVCYTGTGSATTFSHNLQAVPELMICKKKNTSASWTVYSAATGNSAILELDSTGAVQTSVTNWNNTTPTSSVFSVGTQGSVNASGGSYVAYLFATCAGVSKVGSYTGTGTLTTINCGFTGGARFVLIKRTDAVEEWYVWDTIRGMVAATDPSLRFNNQSSESNANSVYTIATGFQLLASPAVDVNTSSGNYIFLAIA